MTDPIICCEQFKENYDKYSGPLTNYDTDYLTSNQLTKVSIKYMESCYPECGPNFAYDPINFCPYCGKKIEYV